jgi:hypothetical protein
MTDDELVVNNGLTTEKFVSEIDRIVKEFKLDMIEAIVYYCERNNLEIETAAAMIKSNARVKSRLQSDAENLNFLPKRAKLQF